MLSQCLESLKGLELFIADTGSIDNTVEIARKYTPNVFTEKKWEDDFAACRNFVKSKCTTDWILSIDADEILHDVGKVREAVALANLHGAKAVDCFMIASDNGQIFKYPRLFKNDPDVFWVGNIHNHLSVLGEPFGMVKITHRYSPAHNLDPDRALRILEKEVNIRPDAVREMFYLAREYAYRQWWGKALEMYSKYLLRNSMHIAERAEAYLQSARCLMKLDQWEEARIACLYALMLNANFKEACVLMSILSGIGSKNVMWDENGKQWLKMAETANNNEVLFVRKEFDFR